MRLIRQERRPDGIISQLCDDEGDVLFWTMEHSFDGEPKIPGGTYQCVRSLHKLHGMTEDFETFEITGVEGHTGLLFHWGNYNEDSDGCVLVGQGYAVLSGRAMVTVSRKAFAAFMEMNDAADSFSLTVEG